MSQRMPLDSSFWARLFHIDRCKAESVRAAGCLHCGNGVLHVAHYPHRKQRPVIIVDEAQHLRNDVLEDLRLLTNYEMDSENRLCLLFVGLTELRRRLQMSVHESVDQRIVMRYNLPRLSREELPEYLSHRLSVAGCELPLFEPASIEAIYQATQSLPRKVNRLAHYALTAAAIAKGKSVTEEHVQAAMSETGS